MNKSELEEQAEVKSAEKPEKPQKDKKHDLSNVSIIQFSLSNQRIKSALEDYENTNNLSHQKALETIITEYLIWRVLFSKEMKDIADLVKQGNISNAEEIKLLRKEFESFVKKYCEK